MKTQPYHKLNESSDPAFPLTDFNVPRSSSTAPKSRGSQRASADEIRSHTVDVRHRPSEVVVSGEANVDFLVSDPIAGSDSAPAVGDVKYGDESHRGPSSDRRGEGRARKSQDSWRERLLRKSSDGRILNDDDVTRELEYWEGEANDSRQPWNGIQGDEEQGWRSKNRWARSRFPKYCAWTVGGLIAFWIMAAIVIAVRKSSSLTKAATKRRLEFNDVFNSTFRPAHPRSVDFLDGSDDGDFAYTDELSSIMVWRVRQGNWTLEEFVNAGRVSRADGRPLRYTNFHISADQQYVLLETSRKKQYRHSFFAEYFIYEVATRKVRPMIAGNYRSYLVTYARWSPVGHSLVFVLNNDLYVNLGLEREVRITHDGSPTVFNGGPDWVYEEEVFASNFVTWWSPSATKIAFLKLDESNVPVYQLPIYGDPESSNAQLAYREDWRIRYPKPGFPNPVVTVWMVDVTKQEPTAEQVHLPDGFSNEDRLIIEVAWSGGPSDRAPSVHEEVVMIKETNRVQSKARLYAAASSDSVKLVRSWDFDESVGTGWVENTLSISRVPGTPGYLDLAVNSEGFTHLAYFESPVAAAPRWLTAGKNFEVVKILGVDGTRVFYLSTELSQTAENYVMGTGRTIWSILLDGSGKTLLTVPESPESGCYYSAVFSPRAKYYILNYEGPGLPWSAVRSVSENGPAHQHVLESNEKLRDVLEEYDMPVRRYFTIPGAEPHVELNAVELVPPDFDPSGSTKYNVLFHVYGGPGSQIVDFRWSLDWHQYLTSQIDLRWIVVTVDNRGTGFRGSAFRGTVRGRLGKLEVLDQIAAAQYMSKRPYVREGGIAVWGWSYGGYMTSKLIEANSGMYAMGIAVAPVTDWYFYDTVYTERYMYTPRMNPSGYRESAVRNMTGFLNTRFLLVHGTGDDNVHLQHSAELLARLTRAKVHNYQVQVYPDSDHSMATYGAYIELYYLITSKLLEAVGRGGSQN